MFIEQKRKDWGQGIPKYEEKDLMDSQTLYDFGLDIIENYVVKEGYKICDINPDPDNYPSFVLKKDDQLYFVLVEANVAPRQPKINDIRRFRMVEHSKKFNAIPLYASCSFGACDHVRFSKSLALKGDAYYCNFTGFQELSVDITNRDKLDYELNVLSIISKALESKNFDEVKSYLKEDTRIYLYTHDEKKILLNKVIGTYIEDYKNKEIFSTLCNFKSNDDKPLLFIGYENERGKQNIELAIYLDSDGKIDEMEFSFNEFDLLMVH